MFYNDSIFHIETGKISPNPYQPRREFNEGKLNELADSIRQYGVLQPLVVSRKETPKEDGGLDVSYELIAGERRLRASKIAGLAQVPVVIRATEDDDKVKLEIAIIENIQREDLNAVDRGLAFQKLIKEFGYKHTEVAKKVGKSREYVSNSLRLLSLPQHMIDAVSSGDISEGHTRPLLMLDDRTEEQEALFKEVCAKKMSVRETERIARRIAYDRARKFDRMHDPELIDMEVQLTETLGTRVQIEKKERGGKVVIDFFSADDLQQILNKIKTNNDDNPTNINEHQQIYTHADTDEDSGGSVEEQEKEPKTDDDDLYTVKNFSL